MSFTNSLPFDRVDPNAVIVEQPQVDSVPLPLTVTEQDSSLAVDYSILQHPTLSREQEYIHWFYYLLWLPMNLIAMYVVIKYFVYLLVTRPTDRERRLLGPKRMTYFFDKLHPFGEKVRNGVTTSAALDVVYSVPLTLQEPKNYRERIMWFWLNQPDAQGPRNRLRITFHTLLEEFERLYRSGRGRGSNDTIQVLSLACGSAHATIEALASFVGRYPQAHVQLLLVDYNEVSLRVAYFLAQHRGVADRVHIKKENLVRYLATAQADYWDIVEMVGFLDYRSPRSLQKFCKTIRAIVRVGGMFVTAQITPSPWSFVVRWVTNWPLLIRRTPQEFARLISWPNDEVSIFTEPTRTHAVAVCKKQ